MAHGFTTMCQALLASQCAAAIVTCRGNPSRFVDRCAPPIYTHRSLAPLIHYPALAGV